jgi:hypothetical protein
LIGNTVLDPSIAIGALSAIAAAGARWPSGSELGSAEGGGAAERLLHAVAKTKASAIFERIRFLVVVDWAPP